MTVLVLASSRRAEALAARLAGPGALTFSAVGDDVTEDDLAGFPLTELATSHESNLLLVRRLLDGGWRARIRRLAVRHRLDAARLEDVVVQVFLMGWGRHVTRLRQFLSLPRLAGHDVRFATDLPAEILEAFLAVDQPAARVARLPSLALRLNRAVAETLSLAGRHLRRLGTLAGMRRLPAAPPGPSRPYVAWLRAVGAELRHLSADKMSLGAFLEESLDGMDVVVQGPGPAALPPGAVFRTQLPALRHRPPAGAILRALAWQLGRLASDMASMGDQGWMTVAGPVLMDIPGLALWFEADPPRAVFYANHVAGGEPPVAALKPRCGVPSMMVFYSVNLGYLYPPRHSAHPLARLNPQSRFYAADVLGMWSEEMRSDFLAAGYASERVPVIAPVHFGAQRGFRTRPAEAPGPVRVAVFDVPVQTVEARWANGIGASVYNHAYTRAFFADLLAAVAEAFGPGGAVVEHKRKRARDAIHAEDVLTGLDSAVPQEDADPEASLWRVLERADRVVCMPFTSVGYIADQFGIPSCFYDPGGTIHPSPLGGRAPLVSGRQALVRWLAEAPRPEGRDPAQPSGLAHVRYLFDTLQRDPRP